MNLLPKSRKARMRLLLLSIIAPVVVCATGLALWGMRDSISFLCSTENDSGINSTSVRAEPLAVLSAAASRRCLRTTNQERLPAMPGVQRLSWACSQR